MTVRVTGKSEGEGEGEGTDGETSVAGGDASAEGAVSGRR